jgi:hypothetical protein
MADRYLDRPFPAQEDYDRGYDRGAHSSDSQKAEGDPLAELARLIGQTDPFGNAGKPPPPLPLQSRANVRPQYQPPIEEEEVAPAAPPPWMQRARHEPPPLEPEEADYQPSPVHPLQRYAAQHPAQEYPEELPYPEPGQELDPSRYDDALYGQIESGEQGYQREPAYPDDPYAYQSGYEDEEPTRKRATGLMTVVAVLALAVVGTGAAFAYRTFVSSPRGGEPPIIKAENGPTKMVPSPSDSFAKTPDRLVQGDGTEKLVSREEAPVDVNTRSAPRVVFPPFNQNGGPPPVAGVTPPPAAANGTTPNNEPRKIRTLSVKGDAADAGVPAGAPPPPAKPTPAARAPVSAPAAAAPPAPSPRNPATANASANEPLSISPQGAPPDPAPPTRVATAGPAPAAGGGGQYVVQLASQKTEADAQASYRALQSKFPAVLGSRQALIKRADLGDKGVYYRAMVGPFGSSDEATQFCVSLKSAGGQCFVPRN